MPAWIEPQLATLVKAAPEGDAWLHEIKLDGYRMHARLDAGAVRFLTRRGNDWTDKYPAIAEAITSLPAAGVTRRLALLEQMSEFFEDAPAQALLGTVEDNPSVAPGGWVPKTWEDDVSENPAPGSTEVWELYNATADAHPMHIHEVVFEVVNRQQILVDDENSTVRVVPGSAPLPPDPWETGFKDTVIAYPGQVTRVKARFQTQGQFVWHCHIVEHEDNEMMRPYRIGPEQPGQPRRVG